MEMLQRFQEFSQTKRGKIVIGGVALLFLVAILYLLIAPSESGGIVGPPGGGGIFDPDCTSNKECTEKGAEYCMDGKCVECLKTSQCANGKECKENKCHQIEDDDTGKQFSCPLPGNAERALCSNSDFCQYDNENHKCMDRKIGEYVKCSKWDGLDQRCRSRNDRCYVANKKCNQRTIPN